MRSVRGISFQKPRPRRYGSIPLESRKLDRDQLGSLVGRVIGGSYKRARRPWVSRKAVRSIFEKTGHLKTITKQAHYDEKDVVQMLKDFRAELKRRRNESGYGLSEQGDYYGKRDKDVYRKFVEETYNQAQAPSRDEERQRELEIRVIKARRRELQREALGLAPISVARRLTEAHTKTEVGRSEARRADLEQRLETILGGKSFSPAAKQAGGEDAARGDTQSAGVQKSQKGGASAPGVPRKGLATITPLFSASLHLPPRHNETSEEDDGSRVGPSDGAENQTRPSSEEKIVSIEKVRSEKQNNNKGLQKDQPEEPDDGQLFAA